MREGVVWKQLNQDDGHLERGKKPLLSTERMKFFFQEPLKMRCYLRVLKG